MNSFRGSEEDLSLTETIFLRSEAFSKLQEWLENLISKVFPPKKKLVPIPVSSKNDQRRRVPSRRKVG
ncbi:MAG TPA: hypothetical protein DCL41_04915 [Bdellovibrionales bacterium]|nr:hypothetical protein [Pseudobdellovibrionaceae bacterium]HAG91187.1 hypothetical protein [Bdellovibrionales bacterium]